MCVYACIDPLIATKGFKVIDISTSHCSLMFLLRSIQLFPLLSGQRRAQEYLISLGSLGRPKSKNLQGHPSTPTAPQAWCSHRSPMQELEPSMVEQPDSPQGWSRGSCFIMFHYPAVHHLQERFDGMVHVMKSQEVKIGRAHV